VPSNNPLVGVGGARTEIWAYGLRNPWRMAFDPATGLLWLGDVGQGDIEEIDIIQRGRNYGWNLFEGTQCFTSPTCDPSGTVLPVTTYGHGGGRCSVTGGYVYRGSAVPELAGQYLFADFCSGELWALPADLSTAPKQVANSPDRVAPFGLDHNGELYLLTFGDPILRITAE
jgi:glucose/arabinose dehydrogenase